MDILHRAEVLLSSSLASYTCTVEYASASCETQNVILELMSLRYYFQALLLCMILISCKNNSHKEFDSIKKIASYQSRNGASVVFKLFLYEDSSFLVENYPSKQLSRGKFSVNYTRYYFYTENGSNSLCDFYYYDNASRNLWVNKGCGDRSNNLEIIK
jgi:hypothetical protein